MDSSPLCQIPLCLCAERRGPTDPTASLRSAGTGGFGHRRSGSRKKWGFYHALRHDPKSPPSLLHPIQSRKDRSSPKTSWAALGSIIYSLGGYCRHGTDRFPSRKVYCFDANRPTEGWKKAPSMIRRRSLPKVVTLDGKLYVFGGRPGRIGTYWAEVFDPKLLQGRGQWLPLPPPPSFEYVDVPIHRLEDLIAMADTKNKKITVGIMVGLSLESSNRFCEFDVTNQCWGNNEECVEELGRHYFPHSNSNPVLVRNTLYWFGADYLYDSADELHAHDIFYGTVHYAGPIQDLSLHLDHKFKLGGSSRPCLIHLAGEYFCLLWVDDDASSMLERSRVILHSTILRVSWNSCHGYGGYSASVLCCRSYTIDHQFKLIDGILMLL